MGSFVLPDPPCGTTECADVLQEVAAAIENRDTIGVAKGLLMASVSCTSDEAFEVLRTESQHLNVKVAEVCERRVEDHVRRLSVGAA